jgi:hypothetical protein
VASLLFILSFVFLQKVDLPPWRPGFDPGSDQVGFVVDKVALERLFSEYFGFPCKFSFHQILHHHNHPGQATIGQSVSALPSGPSWTPPPTKRIKKRKVDLNWLTQIPKEKRKLTRRKSENRTPISNTGSWSRSSHFNSCLLILAWSPFKKILWSLFIFASPFTPPRVSVHHIFPNTIELFLSNFAYTVIKSFYLSVWNRLQKDFVKLWSDHHV